MPRFNSVLTYMIIFLTIANSLVSADEAFKENTKASPKPEIPVKTQEEPETDESSSIPITSRILDRTSYLQRAVNPSSYPVNSTFFVTVVNDYTVKNESLTTITPLFKLNDSALSMKVMNFKPSIHIGEINEYESRISSRDPHEKSPFNKLKHVKFESGVKIDESIDTDRVRVPTSSFRDNDERRLVINNDDDDDDDSIAATRQKIPVKFFETDGRYDFAVPLDAAHHNRQQQQQQQEYYVPQQIELQLPVRQIYNYENANDHDNVHDNRNNDNSDMSQGHEALVTFEYPKSSLTPRPMTFVRPVYPSKMNEPRPIDSHRYQYHEMPIDGTHGVHVKPSKLHESTLVSSPNTMQFQHYEYAASPGNGEAIEKPIIPKFHQQADNYHHGIRYQQGLSHENSMDNIVKPETLVYVTSHRESAVTRMRKFPYKFYEPSAIGHHENEYHYALQDVPHAFPAKEIRVSPWKKIIHLIGAFLPLGLLLATLKPNVVKIENTTQPNIVLSKLRVVDLPAEHKRARHVARQQEKYQQETCDDRSICELIVSGSEPTSNLLQNILWNLTNKSTDEEAQKNGLHEIFSAAKRKDCSSIDC